MTQEIGTSLIRPLLQEAGYDITTLPDRPGLLAEDDVRVVWCTGFATTAELITRWQDEQAWFVGFVGDRVKTVEKSWELYLVLATDLQASPEDQSALEAVRRDASFTRKLIVPGLSVALPSSVRSLLDPLRPLSAEDHEGPLDSLKVLEDAAVREQRSDVAGVIAAFRANRPLFGSKT